LSTIKEKFIRRLIGTGTGLFRIPLLSLYLKFYDNNWIKKDNNSYKERDGLIIMKRRLFYEVVNCCEDPAYLEIKGYSFKKIRFNNIRGKSLRDLIMEVQGE